MASHSLYNFLQKTLWFKNWPHNTSAPSPPTPKLPRPTIFSMALMNWCKKKIHFFAISPLWSVFNPQKGGGSLTREPHLRSKRVVWKNKSEDTSHRSAGRGRECLTPMCVSRHHPRNQRVHSDDYVLRDASVSQYLSIS
jgi:hypothetical protein